MYTGVWKDSFTALHVMFNYSLAFNITHLRGRGNRSGMEYHMTQGRVWKEERERYRRDESKSRDQRKGGKGRDKML